MSESSDSGASAEHTAAAASERATPSAALLHMMTGYWISQAIYIAAKLGISDLLSDAPRSVDELAAGTQTHTDALYRLLRALASVGIYTEVSPRHFALTPLAEPLQSGRPDSMRALAIMYAEEQYRAWGEAINSVRTGQPAFDHAFGARYFDYLATHPESSQVFQAAMVGWTTQAVDAIVTAYDFTPFATVMDVGGGHGALLAAILKASPATHGILFDLPAVVAGAEPFMRTAGVLDRCQCVGGDFFAAIPAGADAYILAQILHDWDDERSLAILREVRNAIPDHGKLLLAELVLPEGDEPFLGKWLDLHMLVLLGGQERTAAQYRELLGASGFTLARVVPTTTGQSVIEALPVGTGR